MYPDAASPLPTETVYNGQSLDGTSSIGEIRYDTPETSGFVSNGYTDNNMNGGSVALSPTPYATNTYNGNGYVGYHDNGSTNGHGSMMSGCIENGSTINGYNGVENGATQFVRRRLLPSIPKGKKVLTLTSFS